MSNDVITAKGLTTLRQSLYAAVSTTEVLDIIAVSVHYIATAGR